MKVLCKDKGASDLHIMLNYEGEHGGEILLSSSPPPKGEELPPFRFGRMTALPSTAETGRVVGLMHRPQPLEFLPQGFMLDSGPVVWQRHGCTI